MKALVRARAVALATALSILATIAGAGSTFANIPLVSGSLSCTNQGQQLITWTVTNSDTSGAGGNTMRIDAVSVTQGTVVGISVGQVLQPQPLAGSSATGTTTLANATGTDTLSVTGHFFTSTGADTGLVDTETATVFFSTNCQQVTQTIAGHIYDCTGGTATTNEVAGGTLGASGPQTVPTQGSPLNPTPVAAGGYTMNATAPSGYQFVICGGTATINSPGSATESVTVPSGGSGVGIFYVSQIPTTPTAMFAPTQTTCQQFVAGTASTENVINYNLKNGVINNVAPGVLFYYTKVTAPAAGSFTVSVSQSDNGNTPPLGAMQLLTYTANCGTYNDFTASTNATSGTSTFTINGASAGQVFILSVKVDPHSVVGSSTPSPSTVTYTYSTSVNNGPAIPSSIQQALLEP